MWTDRTGLIGDAHLRAETEQFNNTVCSVCWWTLAESLFLTVNEKEKEKGINTSYTKF